MKNKTTTKCGACRIKFKIIAETKMVRNSQSGQVIHFCSKCSKGIADMQHVEIKPEPVHDTINVNDVNAVFGR